MRETRRKRRNEARGPSATFTGAVSSFPPQSVRGVPFRVNRSWRAREPVQGAGWYSDSRARLMNSSVASAGSDPPPVSRRHRTRAAPCTFLPPCPQARVNALAQGRPDSTENGIRTTVVSGLDPAVCRAAHARSSPTGTKRRFPSRTRPSAGCGWRRLPKTGVMVDREGIADCVVTVGSATRRTKRVDAA